MSIRTELPLSLLRERVERSQHILRASFAETRDGISVIRQRSSEVESLLREVWELLTANTSLAVSVFALGGFGRGELYPYSDVDVLFLCASESAERDAHEVIRTATQALWDVGLRASPATRTLKECDRLDADGNLEFAISLLDRRFVAGDTALAAQFSGRTVAASILRTIGPLQIQLVESAKTRHGRFGDTIFHLEPNIKECPGGLRDANLIHWLLLLRAIAAERGWPATDDAASLAQSHPEVAAACEFLASTRCFLHFRAGRDENILDWSAQDEAAMNSIGLETSGSVDPAYWMRTYYRHARAISRRACLLMDNIPQAVRTPLLKGLRRKRAFIPGTSFSVEDGRINLDAGASTDGEALLRVFGYVATHGARFDETTEARILQSLPELAVNLPEGPFLWNCLRDILLGPHAAHALRLMHALGVLELILPEFHGIDSLVVRDAYHRYTVDEHTFLVIENIHALRAPRSDSERRFASLLPELERKDLLLLTLLLHDTGKARRTGDHARESTQLAERVFARLEFDLEERDTIRRLIRNHLEMSAALRRDIFDTETVRAFAEHAPGQQQLKMLTLLTYADIKAVHPDALTPWKAENIWQLYIATANCLDRSVDESRYHVDADPIVLTRILSRVAVHSGISGAQGQDHDELRKFLEGIPQRYLQTRLPDQVGEHFRLAQALSIEPIQFAFRPHRQCSEITLITHDRPMLFAGMAGALSAWGMNIVKADAFSNSAGIILDSFQFTDPFRTLELNPGEHERFLTSLRSALAGDSVVDRMLHARRQPRRGPAGAMRTRVEPRFEFDNESSSHSTLLQVVAPDSPGLLRAISAAIASSGCNIEVALVDTEGEIAIDVFYLTASGQKLTPSRQGEIAGRIEESFRHAKLPTADVPEAARPA
jgi:[protein-PII] uridylyltransferase